MNINSEEFARVSDPDGVPGKKCAVRVDQEHQLRMQFHQACRDSPWWCEVEWKEYIDQRPEVQLELAFWESFTSTISIVLTGPILTFELPALVFLYYAVPGSAPPLQQPSFDSDPFYSIWTFF